MTAPTVVDLLCIHARELGLEPEREHRFAPTPEDAVRDLGEAIDGVDEITAGDEQ